MTSCEQGGMQIPGRKFDMLNSARFEYFIHLYSSFDGITVVIFQAREWPLSVTAEVAIAVVQDGTFALRVIQQCLIDILNARV